MLKDFKEKPETFALLYTCGNLLSLLRSVYFHHPVHVFLLWFLPRHCTPLPSFLFDTQHITPSHTRSIPPSCYEPPTVRVSYGGL